ncbi:ribose-5-phosphate isomerase 3 [Spatholobus suberectus]|nr:ribose-5-phosphate isomerase 3 [Spatholobus suberectus]
MTSRSSPPTRSWEFLKKGMVLGFQTDSTTTFVVIKLNSHLTSSKLTNIISVPFFVLDDNPRLNLDIDSTMDANPNPNP